MLSLTEIEINLSVECEKIGHNSESLVQLCLSKSCKQESAVCHLCMTEFHEDCIKQKDLKCIKDIHQLLEPFQQIRIDVKILQQQGNKCEEIIQILSPIDEYKSSPKRANLNSLGKFLKSTSENLTKAKSLVQICQQQIKNKKESKGSANKQIIKTPQDYQNEGKQLYDQQRYKEAVNSYDKAITLSPSAELYNSKGNSLQMLQKYENAIDCYEKAVVLDPLSAKIWFNKGIALYNQKKYKEAIICFQEAIKINPDEINSWISQGNALQELKQQEKAIQSYEKAIQIDKEHSYAWNGKGNALLALQQYEDAIVCFSEALRIDEKFVYAWNGKGAALFGQTNYLEAIICYSEAVRLDPKYNDAKKNLIQAKRAIEL